jgi:hypothetical protein
MASRITWSYLGGSLSRGDLISGSGPRRPTSFGDGARDARAALSTRAGSFNRRA